MYENQKSTKEFLEPTYLVEKIGEKVDELGIEGYFFQHGTSKLFSKDRLSFRHIFALYAINKDCDDCKWP